SDRHAGRDPRHAHSGDDPRSLRHQPRPDRPAPGPRRRPAPEAGEFLRARALSGRAQRAGSAGEPAVPGAAPAAAGADAAGDGVRRRGARSPGGGGPAGTGGGGLGDDRRPAVPDRPGLPAAEDRHRVPGQDRPSQREGLRGGPRPQQQLRHRRVAAAVGDVPAHGGAPRAGGRRRAPGIGVPGRGMRAATMAAMGFCARCGGELPVAARFCPVCGRPVEPVHGPAAPPPARPVLPGFRPPEWVTADWWLVGLGAAVLLGVLFGLSAVVGMVAAVAASGSLAPLPCGAAAGAHLAFAAFAARVAATCGREHGAVLGLAFFPLWWALAAGVATEAALRFGWPRLPDDRTRRIVYAGKLAVATGVAAGLIAGLVGGGRRGPEFVS